MADNNNESSEFQAIDFALGAHIVKAFDGLNPNSGPKQFREFLTRPANKKIYRYDAGTPKEFINELRSSRKSEISLETQDILSHKIVNLPTLPVVVYFRKSGFLNNDDRGSIMQDKIVWDDNLLRSYNLTILPVTQDYKLWFLAWDKLSLDKLQISWYAYVSKPENKRFNVLYRIGKDDFEICAAINDPKSFMMSDISLSHDDGRMFGVETTLTIVTQILFGESVSIPDPAKVYGVCAGCYE
ncbi:MAG: hypothetical protein HQK79_20720 [Desulfobacterales bacterium]|nr:hypothetical protein [Desulfobacterales bacterium]